MLYFHLHVSLNRESRWGTTDDFTASFLHFSLFSTALCDLANSRPVHSLMLSSNLFLCLPCLLPFLTVFCKMVLARPDKRETCPYDFSLHLFTMVRRSSCGPITWWILAQTSSLITWYLAVVPHFHGFCISAVMVHDSQAYRKIEVTREHIVSRILELRELLLSFQTGFSSVKAAVVCATLKSISTLEPLSVTTEPGYLKPVTVSSFHSL